LDPKLGAPPPAVRPVDAAVWIGIFPRANDDGVGRRAVTGSETMAWAYCWRCGARCIEGSRFCPSCGADSHAGRDTLREPAIECPTCGATVAWRARFCPLCGRPIELEPPANPGSDEARAQQADAGGADAPAINAPRSAEGSAEEEDRPEGEPPAGEPAESAPKPGGPARPNREAHESEPRPPKRPEEELAEIVLLGAAFVVGVVLLALLRGRKPFP
jgi:endogenous inhibitor of DNA gyrase (YacG/DUF329 family)